MVNKKFSILTDENEIIEYERACYRAFSTKASSDATIKKSTIIDGDRLRPHIPQEDLIQYALRIDDRIAAGLKIHINIKNEFQTEKRGFAIEKRKNTCEGLNFFALGEGFDPFEFFNIMEEFTAFIMNDLKNRLGMKSVYGTCHEKIKVVYLRAGFGIIDSKIIEGEKILLLKMDL